MSVAVLGSLQCLGVDKAIIDSFGVYILDISVIAF